MTAQRHLVQRLVLELDLPARAGAGALQSELGVLCRRELVPAIERCLAEADTADRVHRIDTLALDLGLLDPGRLDLDLVAGLRRTLRPALAERIAAARAAAPAGRIDAALETLGQVARRGALPWWADAARPGLIAETLTGLAGQAPGALARLLAGLAAVPGALARLARYLDGGTLDGLLPVTGPPAAGPGSGPGASAAGAVDAPRPAAGGTDAGAAPSVAPDWPPGEAVAVQTLLHLLQQPQAVASPLIRLLMAALAREPGGLERLAAHPDLAGRLADLAARSGHDTHPDPAGTPGRPLPLHRSVTIPAAPAPDPGGAGLDRAAGRPWDGGDALYVGDCGLVILWPFLERFLVRLGLAADAQFVDEPARRRAVGLLHYLAGADPAPPEHELALAKTLCGLPLEPLFDLGPPITAAESAECETLLGAVIAHAEILAGTSIPGLRATFLARRGALVSDGDALVLRVEEGAFDVVLGRLPWGIEWVRLPWMRVPLQVQW